MTRFVIPVFVTLVSTAPAQAQDAPPLAPGTEVRVSSPSVTGRYVVDRHGPDTLTLRDGRGGIVHVAMASLTELSVSRGRRPAGARALRGAGLGLLIGAGSGAVIGFASGDDPPGFFSFTAEEKATVLGVLMGGGGAAIGTVIGLLSRDEQWKGVPLNTVRAGPSSDGGMTIGYAIRF